NSLLKHEMNVLLHDGAGHQESVKALPEIIRYFREQGYQFAVLSPEVKPIQFRLSEKADSQTSFGSYERIMAAIGQKNSAAEPDDPFAGLLLSARDESAAALAQLHTTYSEGQAVQRGQRGRPEQVQGGQLAALAPWPAQEAAMPPLPDYEAGDSIATPASGPIIGSAKLAPPQPDAVS